MNENKIFDDDHKHSFLHIALALLFVLGMCILIIGYFVPPDGGGFLPDFNVSRSFFAAIIGASSGSWFMYDGFTRRKTVIGKFGFYTAGMLMYLEAFLLLFG